MRFVAVLLVCVSAFCAEALTFSNRYRSPRNPERRIRTATRMVVLHTTEAHAKSSLNKLCERGECHYCITEDGTAYRIIDREREAFHAGRSMWNGREDCDAFSVGIEVVGHHNEPVTRAQLQAIRELVGSLKKIYNLNDTQVLCHSHVAYGAPNKWQRRNHRGRKRCGMLFAMPSVRVQLGLRSKPAYDPDVKAHRLIQADPYLGQVLYGDVDTMAGRYARGAVAAPGVKKKESSGLFSGIRKWFSASKAESPKQPPTKAPAKQAPAKASSKPAFQKGVLKGAPTAAAPAPTPIPKPNATKDLAALNALKGYRKAILGDKTTPFTAAGKRWNAADTYYFTHGKVVPGNKVKINRLEKGAVIYFKK